MAGSCQEYFCLDKIVLQTVPAELLIASSLWNAIKELSSLSLSAGVQTQDNKTTNLIISSSPPPPRLYIFIIM